MKFKLIIFPLSIVAVMFMFFYLIKPAWAERATLNKKLIEEQKSLNELKQNKQNIDKAFQDYQQIDFDKKLLIKNSIPSNSNENHFLKELNDISDKTSTEFLAIDFSKNNSFSDISKLEENDFIETVSGDIELVGGYFGIRKALYLIESANRLAIINSFELSSKEEENALTLSLNLDFFHKEHTAITTIDLKDKYFNELVNNGLKLDTVTKYSDFREETIDFDLIDTEGIGRDDLFSQNPSSAETLEEEITTE